MTEEESEKIRFQLPPSKLEGEVNIENARRAVKAVNQVCDIFLEKIPPEEGGNLFGDGFVGGLSVC
jgi:hypothetical protein